MHDVVSTWADCLVGLSLLCEKVFGFFHPVSPFIFTGLRLSCKLFSEGCMGKAMCALLLIDTPVATTGIFNLIKMYILILTRL